MVPSPRTFPLPKQSLSFSNFCSRFRPSLLFLLPSPPSPFPAPVYFFQLPPFFIPIDFFPLPAPLSRYSMSQGSHSMLVFSSPPSPTPLVSPPTHVIKARSPSHFFVAIIKPPSAKRKYQIFILSFLPFRMSIIFSVLCAQPPGHIYHYLVQVATCQGRLSKIGRHVFPAPPHCFHPATKFRRPPPILICCFSKNSPLSLSKPPTLISRALRAFLNLMLLRCLVLIDFWTPYPFSYPSCMTPVPEAF